MFSVFPAIMQPIDIRPLANKYGVNQSGRKRKQVCYD
jgi:hypothetical protein